MGFWHVIWEDFYSGQEVDVYECPDAARAAYNQRRRENHFVVLRDPSGFAVAVSHDSKHDWERDRALQEGLMKYR